MDCRASLEPAKGSEGPMLKVQRNGMNRKVKPSSEELSSESCRSLADFSLSLSVTHAELYIHTYELYIYICIFTICTVLYVYIYIVRYTYSIYIYTYSILYTSGFSSYAEWPGPSRASGPQTPGQASRHRAATAPGSKAI